MKEWLLKALFGIVATTTAAVSAPIVQAPQPIPEPQIIERQTVVKEVQNNTAYEAKISALDKRIATLEKRIIELEVRKPEEKVTERVEVREVPTSDNRIPLLQQGLNDFITEQKELYERLDKQTDMLCHHSVAFGGKALRYQCQSDWWNRSYP